MDFRFCPRDYVWDSTSGLEMCNRFCWALPNHNRAAFSPSGFGLDFDLRVERNKFKNFGITVQLSER